MRLLARIVELTKELKVGNPAEHDIDLERSFAYADSSSDLPMLSAVGNPCAMNPDFKLRTTARAYQWAVLELDS